MTIQSIYAARRRNEGHIFQIDINESMPWIRFFASSVRHITEFGVRTGNSTSALLSGLLDGGGGTYRGYDLSPQNFGPDWPAFIPGVDWTFTQADTAQLASIEPTELLFVDSCHDCPHVMAEFRQHTFVKKYIIMHDTAHGCPAAPGPRDARDTFLRSNSDWVLLWETQEQFGLSVLARIPR